MQALRLKWNYSWRKHILANVDLIDHSAVYEPYTEYEIQQQRMKHAIKEIYILPTNTYILVLLWVPIQLHQWLYSSEKQDIM